MKRWLDYETPKFASLTAPRGGAWPPWGGPAAAMSLVFAGICSHAPGITGRAHLADPAAKDAFHGAFRRMGEELHTARPDALIVVGAEHFGNFFMDNMPSFAIGMADVYEGPIEDPTWLGIARTQVPGTFELSPGRRGVQRG